jgi:hypothetical protein
MVFNSFVMELDLSAWNPSAANRRDPSQRQNWWLADGSVNRPSRVVVLAEDTRQQQFVRRYLYRLGYNHYQIEFEPPVSGRGSGEQWVRARYARTVLAYRAQTKRVSTALIVVIDADKGGVATRRQQFQASLRESRVTARGDDEPVVHQIPKRNIETWVLCLTGAEVDEETDYHDRPRINEQIAPAAIAFFDGSRPSMQAPEHSIASLRSAIPEVQRLP